MYFFQENGNFFYLSLFQSFAKGLKNKKKLLQVKDSLEKKLTLSGNESSFHQLLILCASQVALLIKKPPANAGNIGGMG